MAPPSIPQHFYLQQGNGQVYLLWDKVPGAQSYNVLRCTDNINFLTVSSPLTPYYLDTSVTPGIQYFYKVQAFNGDGTGISTSSQGIIPALTGQISLAQARLMSQFKAEMVNSNYITLPEWNMNINQSYTELYDLLVNTYEDYFQAPPYSFVTDGINTQFNLPPNYFKLSGVDLGLNGSFITLNKFEFIDRNKNTYYQTRNNPVIGSDLRYRIMGNSIVFNCIPGANQTIRLWYTPRLNTLLADTDMLDGINGWSEYVIVDAAIKALQKEESDTSALEMSKQRLVARILASAPNRDASQPDKVSDTRSERQGSYNAPYGWY